MSVLERTTALRPSVCVSMRKSIFVVNDRDDKVVFSPLTSSGWRPKARGGQSPCAATFVESLCVVPSQMVLGPSLLWEVVRPPWKEMDHRRRCLPPSGDLTVHPGVPGSTTY